MLPRRHATATSDVMLRVGERLEDLDGRLLRLDRVAGLRAHRHTLVGRARQLLTGLLLVLRGALIVGRAALLELLLAPRRLDVLDADVDALAATDRADDLGELDAHRAPGHVEDAARAAVVEGVRHALLDGRVRLDVDIVATLEDAQVPGEAREALGLVGLGELVAGARAETVGVRHGGEGGVYHRG